MKRTNRLTALLLAAILCLSLGAPALASGEPEEPSTEPAEIGRTAEEETEESTEEQAEEPAEERETDAEESPEEPPAIRTEDFLPAFDGGSDFRFEVPCFLYYSEAFNVLREVNRERGNKGLPPLTMDAGLLKTAMLRAAEIYLLPEHDRPNGTACFTAFPSGHTTMGENIAYGQENSAQVMNSWMNSPVHYANIMDSRFTAVGVGCVVVDGEYYWTQCFGSTTNGVDCDMPKDERGTVLVELAADPGVFDAAGYLRWTKWNAARLLRWLVGLPVEGQDTQPPGDPGDPVIPPDSPFGNVQAGDTIVFGRYEQDNNAGNGREDITWRVLDKQGGRILVVSQYGLDAQAYNDSSSVEWSTCTLRSWLNGTFLSGSFTAEEQARILTTEIESDYSYDGDKLGSDTSDRIFLLSMDEALRYFDTDEDRRCVPTDYARARNVIERNGYSWWWLRDYGTNPMYIFVGLSGSISNPTSGLVTIARGAVRPAMWLDITG